MDQPLPPGKLPPELMARLLARAAPSPPEVLLGPAPGEDACAIAVPGGVLVATTDPITMTGGRLGRYAVTINANDVAVTGVRPRWFLASVLLPEGTTEAAVADLFAELHEATFDCGVTLVGGHTEVTPAVNRTVIVGQMLGLAADSRFVRTGGSRVGDSIVQVGPAPVEGGAVLAAEAPARLAELDPEVVRAAANGIDDPGLSVVEAALLAARLGATALHDPTEGGLAAGLHELGTAAGQAVVVDRARLLWWPPGIEACRAVGADPLASLASGTVLAAFSPEVADTAVTALGAAGFAATVIGRVDAGSGVTDTSGAVIPLPRRDEVSRVLD